MVVHRGNINGVKIEKYFFLSNNIEKLMNVIQTETYLRWGNSSGELCHKVEKITQESGKSPKSRNHPENYKNHKNHEVLKSRKIRESR